MSNFRIYFGAGLISLAFFLAWILIYPLYNNVTALDAAVKDRNTTLSGREATLANIKNLSQQYSANTSQVQRFSDIVPAQKSQPELVSSIQAMASQNGLQLIGISLAGQDSTQTQNPFQKQPLDLVLSGSYPAFKSFLQNLEHNIRVIDIQSIDASPPTDNSPLVNFRLRGYTYYLK